MVTPLEGIKVVDLTHTAPGPYCTMILGDLGADVLRVQEPVVRSGRRASERPGVSPEQEERQAAFDPHSRNKRSIVLNLKDPAAREVFYRLADDADVVTESFRPGVVKRLGVDYETLSKRNPRLIYCSITGFGQDGPYAQLPGHDINYIAIAGALGITGPAAGPPTPPGNLVGDFAGGGMQGALAVITALYARTHTGRGQYLDISMTDGVLALMTSYAGGYFSRGDIPKRGAYRHSGLFPWFRAYETADGKYFSLGCSEPWFYANLVRSLGREDMIPYQNDTGQKSKELEAFLTKTFKTKTREEWWEFCKENEICAGPVYDLDEVFSDPQIKARGMVAEIQHPKFGTIRQVASPMKFSDTPASIRRLAPRKGEHTEEVLTVLGYSAEERQRMRSQGAVE